MKEMANKILQISIAVDDIKAEIKELEENLDIKEATFEQRQIWLAKKQTLEWVLSKMGEV